MSDKEFLLEIENGIRERLLANPPSLDFMRQAFIALAVLMECLVSMDPEKKQYMYVLIRRWIDNNVSDDLYEALANANGAMVREDD